MNLSIASVLSQHAEEAAFLWLLRDSALHAAGYDLDDLATHDNRVEAHIDGLRVAGEAGWQLALEKERALNDAIDAVKGVSNSITSI